MGRDTDRLRIISMMGSEGRGRQHWEFRRPHIDTLIGQQQPDLMLLPGDDPDPKTMVVENYEQYLEPSQNGTVLLYDPKRLRLKTTERDWLRGTPDFDINKLVFPSIDVLSPAPSQTVVKPFQVKLDTHEVKKSINTHLIKKNISKNFTRHIRSLPRNFSRLKINIDPTVWTYASILACKCYKVSFS